MNDEKENCGNCKYWRNFKEETAGICRRYPPTLIKKEEIVDLIISFPTTYSIEWCGEWQKNT